jgi:hypothetical protein
MRAINMSNCDWPDCLEPATHRVEVVYRDGRTDEVRLLCRDHDDAWKVKVRKEVGPKPGDPPPPTVPATVACGECGRVLDEPQDRGRDGDCSPPPAQIPASGTTALGSYLG